MDFLNFTDDDDSQPQPSAPLTNIDEGTRQDTSLDATFEEVHQLGPADEVGGEWGFPSVRKRP